MIIQDTQLFPPYKEQELIEKEFTRLLLSEGVTKENLRNLEVATCRAANTPESLKYKRYIRVYWFGLDFSTNLS